MFSKKMWQLQQEKWDKQIEFNRNELERVARIEAQANSFKRDYDFTVSIQRSRLDELEKWRDRGIERQTRAEEEEEKQPTNVNLHMSSQYSRGFSDGILAALAAIFRNRA